jgi:hypothetical protein
VPWSRLLRLLRGATPLNRSIVQSFTSVRRTCRR